MPLEREVYSKEAQTDVTVEDIEEKDREVMRARQMQAQSQAVLETASIHSVASGSAQTDREIKKDEFSFPIIPKRLTDDEQKRILNSDGFLEFFGTNSKYVERALNENEMYDFLVDYTMDGDMDSDESAGKTVKEFCNFSSEKYTKSRSVTDLDWSSKHEELLLASYSKTPNTLSDKDGLLLVWNLHSPSRPEFTLECQSEITSSIFSRFHPYYIFGGTYSGQIVVWDIRSNKRQPTLKTPMSANGHTDPVYSINMVGTQNAHNLVTASNDGLVCSWVQDLMSFPENLLNLTLADNNNEVAVTCLTFPENETSTFWVGTEEGNVYQGNRYIGAGSKSGLHQNDVYKGHSGMITSVSFHPRAPDLFLTSSVDWTVKLWRAKSKPSLSQTITAPLYSFEDSDDYVFDVKWSPTHPSLFGSVDGSGRLNLWNLNTEMEVPDIVVQTQSRALN
ncbi:hypothetical protein HK096_007088, partial [Nowakowskiella sp. JEL0078]